MARKKTHFQWTDDEDGGTVHLKSERRNRSQDKARAREIEALILDAIAARPSARERLPVDRDVLDALHELAGRPPGPARKRQFLRIKSRLYYDDPEPLRAALAGADQPTEALRAVERWRTRLIEGDDTTLQACLDAYPSADRQHLRTAVRSARSAAPGSKAFRQLYTLLKGWAANEDTATESESAHL